jgi:hypothetical protein
MKRKQSSLFDLLFGSNDEEVSNRGVGDILFLLYHA